MPDPIKPLINGKEFGEPFDESNGGQLAEESDTTVSGQKAQAGKDPRAAPLPPPSPTLQEQKDEIEYVKGYPVIRNGECF
jgi:hypothetical protein